MIDMTSVTEPKSDQINADDLFGGDLTITITEVKITPGAEQPVSIQFEGSERAFRPCKSMSRVLVAVWGPDANKYVGRSLRLYRDPEVSWGGMKVGGIRIREMSDMDRPMTLALTDKRGSRKPTVIKPLVIETAKADTPDPKALMDAARVAARGGKESFQAHWKSLGEAQRMVLLVIKQECIDTAKAVDAQAATSDDPFGDIPTPDDLARAESDTLAAIAARDGEASA